MDELAAAARKNFPARFRIHRRRRDVHVRRFSIASYYWLRLQ
jgi:hypothetical protein